MKLTVRLIALLMGILMLSGCGPSTIGEKQSFNPNLTVGESQEQTQENTQQKVDTLKLPCDYDSLIASPWNCADQNSRKAAMLLYDSPVFLTQQFQAEPALVTVSGSGTQWTLTVRDGVTFSDGSALTAQEIDNSLTMAMAEGSYYRNALTNISSHKATSDTQVEVTLNTADALFANLLTFPVAKLSGSTYIGTGKYVYSAKGESSQDSTILKKNPSYWGEASSIDQIELISLTKKDVATYSLKLGEIDGLYTEGASSDIANLSTSNYPVISNQLIFLGANSTRGDTANAALRQAISLALDRQYLIQSAFSTSAIASASPLHPNFLSSTPTQDLEGAKKLLSDAGLTSEGSTLQLSLLYCSDGADRLQTANQIAAQLAEVGIEVTLEAKNQEEYFSTLNSGSYDLYLGEILLGDDMDLSHLLTKGERYGYGSAPSEALTAAYQTAFSTGEGWDTFVTTFQQEYPVIPLAFRNNTFSLARKYSLSVNATRNNLFYQMEDWQ